MQTIFFIPFLFLLISILFALEASTSIARLAGLNAGSLASGMQLQNGLSLFSRVVMAIFMPMLGALSDLGYFNKGNLKYVYYSSLFIPLLIIVVLILKNHVLKIYQNSTINLVEKGTYFPIKKNNSVPIQKNRKKHRIKKLNIFRWITFISYIPYYLAWTAVMIALSMYQENRGFILGISSILNGINTLVLVAYIDPLLIKFSRYSKISNYIYIDQLRLRIASSLIASVPFALYAFLF